MRYGTRDEDISADFVVVVEVVMVDVEDEAACRRTQVMVGVVWAFQLHSCLMRTDRTPTNASVSVARDPLNKCHKLRLTRNRNHTMFWAVVRTCIWLPCF
jgi:hypothetical protein